MTLRGGSNSINILLIVWISKLFLKKRLPHFIRSQLDFNDTQPHRDKCILFNE